MAVLAGRAGRAAAPATPDPVAASPIAVVGGADRGGDARSDLQGERLGEGDLPEVVATLADEILRLNESVEQLTRGKACDHDDLLAEVDARFRWLTDQLSARLVTLGNELVAVKRQLEHALSGAANGTPQALTLGRPAGPSNDRGGSPDVVIDRAVASPAAAATTNGAESHFRLVTSLPD